MGGATISFLNMVKGLVDLGVDPLIVVPQKRIDPLFLKRVSDYGWPIKKCFLIESVLLERQGTLKKILKKLVLPLLKYYSFRQLLKIAKEETPMLIHTNTGIIHEGFDVASKLGIQHIWHLREYQDKDFKLIPYPSFEQFCVKLKKSNVISITEDILTHFGLSVNCRHKVIANGIMERNEFIPHFNKQKYFLCASRISAEKGITDAILAFADFDKVIPDYELWLAGTGDESYIKELKSLCLKLKCDSKVRFLGFRTDVKVLISMAKALIVPSYFEGFGRMIAEACFCKTMVVGRNTGGTKCILNYTGGLLFATNQELLEQLKFVANIPSKEYEKMVLIARDKAIAAYSIEQNVINIKNVYDNLLNDEK